MDMYIRRETLYKNKQGKITKVKFHLNNGTIITAEPCYESWQQWGGKKSELALTVERLEELNQYFQREEVY